MSKNYIVVKGAKENNLKNIDVKIPRDQFVIITGLSGSGKSSLAFDTIYAEGQRRYVESLSAYARQFLGQMEKPNVESIEGLSPAISIDQKTTSKNPRSTVGTVTEIYDYLRLLFARIGIPHCPICGREIAKQSIDQIVDKIMGFEEKTKFQILAPVIRGKKGSHEKVIEYIRKEGFSRLRIDKEMVDIQEPISMKKTAKHDIDVVVDRIVVRTGIEARLAESLEIALTLGDGLVIIHLMDQGDLLMSTNFACPEHGTTIEELEPRTFSFNSPYGACTSCKGLGYVQKIDQDLIIEDWELSINGGGLVPFANSEEGTYYYQMIKSLADAHGIDLDQALKDLPKKFIKELLYGTGTRKIDFNYESRFGGKRSYDAPFEGIVNNLERRYKETNSDYMRDKIGEFMSLTPCETCLGRRLKPEVLAVTVNGKNISEVTDFSVKNAIVYIEELILTKNETIIAEQIVKEIKSRFQFLENVGLDYLTLSRSAGTLSGGEAQRIRLATQVGSGLVGVLYILDEPSIGLHQKDNAMLIRTLRKLTDLGNTLIVVEHDEETMQYADHIIDIGPGAGIHGGEVVAEGSIEDIKNCEASITGQYLSGTKKIEVPSVRRIPEKQFIEIIGAKENNLKNIDVKMPLGLFTCITGVSGSGKSTLINEILYKSIAQKINRTKAKPGKHSRIDGVEYIDKIINIDQLPIGKTPRSNPATYTGVFNHIRDLFAQLPEAKIRGYKKGRFSFNVKGGRCEACKGDGILKIEMHFLPDVYVPCDVCDGKRYNRETLEVKYKGKSIYDVLDMTLEDAEKFFGNIPSIKRKLETLNEVGLSYVKLGQPSTQLSGGEAQRVKLATELSKRSTGKTLYILDEPTTGLHTADVHKLIDVLNKLVDAGNTMIVIEHNLDVIKSSDYIIDLGPNGGEDGGFVIGEGTPEALVKIKESYTGQYLKKVL